MNEHILILKGYIDHLEYMKKNADEFFDREQADKDIEAFKAAIKALEQEKSETVTEFADRCRECGARYGKLLKDAISRQAVLDIVNNPLNIRLDEIIKKLPPVNPQTKTGHWILDESDNRCICSECKKIYCHRKVRIRDERGIHLKRPYHPDRRP